MVTELQALPGREEGKVTKLVPKIPATTPARSLTLGPHTAAPVTSASVTLGAAVGGMPFCKDDLGPFPKHPLHLFQMTKHHRQHVLVFS